jgi:hypothetical protein
MEQVILVSGTKLSPVGMVVVILQPVGQALCARLLSLHALPTVFCPLPLDLFLLLFFPHIFCIGLDPVAFCIFACIDSYKEKKEILIRDKNVN